MKNLIEIFLLGILFSFDGFCKVRTLHTNNQRMELVKLKIGKSTLLSFSSKPTKIVVGNPDFLEVEFVNTELTIRPKGIAKTNMFVYTKRRIYGLLIQVVSGEEYDDLIHIKWSPYYESLEKNRKGKKKIISISNKQVNSLRFNFTKVEFVKEKKILLIDFFIENISKEKLDLKNLGVRIFFKKKELKIIAFILSGNTLREKERARGKIIVRPAEKEEFYLLVKFAKETYRFEKKGVFFKNKKILKKSK